MDPGRARPASPASWNRFSYTRNRPMNLTDPTGLVDNATVKYDWETTVGLRNSKLVPATIDLGATLAACADWTNPFEVGSATGEAVAAGDSTGQIALAVAKDAVRGLSAATLVVSGVQLARGVAAAMASTRIAQAGTRATVVHGALDPIAQGQRTTAVLETSGPRIVAGGGRDLTPAQRALLGPGEVGARLPGAHAEVTALQEAAARQVTPEVLVTTRAICPECQAAIEATGGQLVSPTAATW